MIAVHWNELGDDRDAYLGIARAVASGCGLCAPGGQQPTAFRPPLYPLLLAPVSDPAQQWGIVALHLTLACGTLYFLWKTGIQLKLGQFGTAVACTFYTIDPLLLRYFSLPMTETLCAFMGAWLLYRLSAPRQDARHAFFTGIVFGLAGLSRPTFWAFAFLWGTYLAWTCWQSERRSEKLKYAGWLTIGALLLLLSWGGRNWATLGHPVLMTTHGGYTVLLGNNESFYQEVVQQPWGTLWDGSHGLGQQGWVRKLQSEIDAAGLEGEVETDKWLSQRARGIIQANPELFARAVLLRFLRFWNVVPIGPGTNSLPPFVVFGVGAYYAILWTLVSLGLMKSVWTRHWKPLVPAILLMIAFNLVHLVYWSNARMRAPVMPAVVLLAAVPFSQSYRTRTTPTTIPVS